MTGPILLQMILIFLNAAFASAEIAVISMSESRLRLLADGGDRRAARLAALTAQPARFLATIQVAITLAGLMGSAFAAESFAGPLVSLAYDFGIRVPQHVLEPAAVVVITLILAYFNLVFGELVPKRIAMKKSESMALGMAGMLHGVSKIFAPLVWLLTVSTDCILRMCRIDPKENGAQVTEEEIRMMLAEGREQGVIDEEEDQMLQNVFAFEDQRAEQLLTHRIDIIWLSSSDSAECWAQTICSSRYSFYPVCGKTADQVIGVLNTKEYFRLENKDQETVMEKAVEKPYFVPETIRANVLLRQMKISGRSFAVVIDEYGGLSGIITLRDLLEALVGELPEETGSLLNSVN